MPRQLEPNANNALRDILRRMLPGCDVHSETSRVFRDYPGKHPDVLITASDRAPVVIEAEYEPAAEVERDAADRLAQPISGQSRRVEAAIALKYPGEIAEAYDLQAAISDARLSYSVLYADKTRFPKSGWLTGSVSDIADLIRLVSIPQREVDDAAQALEDGIESADAVMSEMVDTAPADISEIAKLLGMANVPQTRRMACAIIANALMFQERIAALHESVQRPRVTCAAADPQGATLAAWREILRINYYPIFAIGMDILTHIGDENAARILRILQQTASAINAASAANSRDLTGLIFQRLISDRKYLATFYTLPPSAVLLARLAVAKMNGVDWTDADAIRGLRVADFACGTGTLLAAVYDQFISRYERTGGDAADLHKAMMEDALFGCDVMPSAVHITGATLSGMQPRIGYDNSQLYTLAYGRQTDNTVRIGSLELLRSSAAMSLFNTSDPAMRTGSIGQETASQIIVDIPDEGFDLVIMNPPFTRATNHEGAHADITNPAFAAFDATPQDQTRMGTRLNAMGRASCYHGNAGIASGFAALADKKLKPGGVLALVLPLSAASGLSWEKFRRMLESDYAELTVVSIASSRENVSFSSDTGMSECLIIARKLNIGERNGERALFTSLRRRPQEIAQATATAAAIADSGDIRGIEDGPYGGTRVVVGNEVLGESMTAAYSDQSSPSWNFVRSFDGSVAQTAYALEHSRLWLPGQANPLELKTAPLGVVGKLGFVHRDITGPAPRGPFDKMEPNPNATFPSLWNHNAKNETRIVCEPDSELIVRRGMEAKAHAIAATASRAHLNLELRFNSQPLAAAFTEKESIGGVAWPNVCFSDGRFDCAFAIWSNCTLGLALYWWSSNLQQAGRGRTTIRSAETLPTLDLRALTDAQLDVARDIFDDFRDRELQPAYIADADRNRALLDRRVVCDMLGFDESVYAAVRSLATKWCAEPSVHGGKARPKGAEFAV